MRAWGQEVSRSGAGHQPVPGSLTAYHPRTATRTPATSKLIPTNFSLRAPARSRRPELQGAQGDPPAAAPATPARPSLSHSFGPAPGAALPPAPGLGASPRGPGRLGSGTAVPGTKRRMRGTASWTASATPAHPPPHASPGRDKRAPKAERNGAPKPAEEPEPALSVIGNLSRPKSKEKVLCEKLSEAPRSSLAWEKFGQSSFAARGWGRGSGTGAGVAGLVIRGAQRE